MSDHKLNAYNINDLREIAIKRTPKFLFEFLDRGSEDEVALRNNRAVFERIRLMPRMLCDVSVRNQEITLFGQKQKMPIAVAPTGITGLLWHEGEIAAAKAAKAAGIPFALATSSPTSLEQVAEQVGGRLWFQLYMWADRKLSYGVVERAKAAGYEALIVTVDGPVYPNREYNHHNGFTVSKPFSFNRKTIGNALARPRWLWSVVARYLLTTGIPKRANFPKELQQSILTKPSLAQNASLTWDDIRVLRKMWPGKLMVKGILHPQDAVKAADCGADAVILSNHGGRILDATMAPIEVLPQVADAVGKRMTIIVDSGFRRGSDVVKALALGAKAVLIGRPMLYGTAVAGEAGAARTIEIFREEIERVMGLIGCRNLDELNADFVRLP